MATAPTGDCEIEEHDVDGYDSGTLRFGSEEHLPDMCRSTIGETWKLALRQEFEKSYFGELCKFVVSQREKLPGRIHPPATEVFVWTRYRAISDVKVVIIAQDPYPMAGVAHGLAFSATTQHPQIRPSSLMNIFKELERERDIEIAKFPLAPHGDLNGWNDRYLAAGLSSNTNEIEHIDFEIAKFQPPPHGDLSGWASQGVLLLNTILTVRDCVDPDGKTKAQGAKGPGSHKGRGWEKFTDAVIRCISDENKNVVFMLWGKYAQSKAGLIDEDKHKVLRTSHPSPLSRHAGFDGCGHFAAANGYLWKTRGECIQWWNLQKPHPRIFI